MRAMLGRLHLSIGDVEAAWRELRRASNDEPDHPAILRDAARAAHARGDRETAATLLERAATLNQ